MTIARHARLLEATMPEIWDTSSLGPICIDMRPNTLEQLLCAAEIAKAAYERVREEDGLNWRRDHANAENAWITAQTELSIALVRRTGLDISRVVEVLS